MSEHPNPTPFPPSPPNPADLSSEVRDKAVGLLAAIVESSEDAIISKSLDSVVTSWNAGAERLFGYTAAEAIGRNIRFIIPADRQGEEDEIIAKLRAGERIDHFETVRMRKDGSTVDISLTVSPVRDPAGRIVGASKIARDISAWKTAEKALRESEERFRTLAETLDAEVRLRTVELEERTNEVVKQSEHVRELSHRLLRAEDDQRRQIARELHDSAGQLLAALSINLDTVLRQRESLDTDSRKAIDDSCQLVAQITREVRTISHLLHPPLLDIAGLTSALRWYVDGFTERSKIKVSLQFSEEFPRLSDEMELAIFRMVQECLTNVHRHSGSESATIAIEQQGTEIVIGISDHGTGIPAEKHFDLNSFNGTGVGFRGLRERLRHLGGDMKIESNHCGTLVSARLPYAPVPEPSANCEQVA